MSHLYDVGCMNHMADLIIKAGMETLTVNIARYLLIYFIIFTIVKIIVVSNVVML